MTLPDSDEFTEIRYAFGPILYGTGSTPDEAVQKLRERASDLARKLDSLQPLISEIEELIP